MFGLKQEQKFKHQKRKKKNYKSCDVRVTESELTHETIDKNYRKLMKSIKNRKKE